MKNILSLLSVVVALNLFMISKSFAQLASDIPAPVAGNLTAVKDSSKHLASEKVIPEIKTLNLKKSNPSNQKVPLQSEQPAIKPPELNNSKKQ